MSFADIAAMAIDSDLRLRISACAATQTLVPDNPLQWTDKHQWQIAGSPTWSEAWAYAVLSGNTNPGADPAVISDAMILSAVQATG